MRFFPIAASLAVLGFGGTAHAITYFVHEEAVTNNTGKTANDITLELIHPALQDPARAVSIAASAFGGGTACCVGASTVTITGPPGSSVPNGGSMTVGWLSAFASDLLLNTTFWTFNGANIGPATTNNAISWNLTPNPGGTVTVALNNTSGSPIAYSGLAVDTGAPVSDFGPDVAAADADLGTAITPLIAPSGTLPTGLTAIATFRPDALGYSGETIMLDGSMLFLGESNVPEPGTWMMIGLGVLGAGAALRRRRSLTLA